MRLLALFLSALIAVLGVIGIVAPARLLAIARSFDTPLGLYAAAALRLVLGTALFLAAPASRAPRVLRVLGIVSFVAGLITPFIGVDRYRRLLEWWSAWGPGFLRGWAVIALTLGLFLIYALATPARSGRDAA
jgi:hypothetical protein